MVESTLLGIVSVIVLGIGAQWLAWKLRLPSILLLLIVGFLAGPVSGILPPETLQGDWLFAFVSVSIGIILFEGGLSLRISEFREIGAAVLSLITLGVLITWVLAGLAAYYIVGLNAPLASLAGAIVTVTGPTVVIPLLRHVRPRGRISNIARWEGITIDPVGAILAVLVLEAVILLNSGEAGSTLSEGIGHAFEGLMLTVVASVGIGVLGAGFLVLVIHNRLVPDFLQTSVALMIVVATFALSNSLQHESGLLEVTLMGILLANQKYVDVRRIAEFKEDLQVLLIGSLFILLSARLDLSVLSLITWRSFAFLGILILVVRPVAVFVSALFTNLDLKEKVFLSWLAPRGIVAAAVASLFAFRLEPIFPEQAPILVPLIFLVIVGTVAIYGLSISPLAKYLGLADQNPQGILMLGAHPWARQLARVVMQSGHKVMMIDTNLRNIMIAKQMGINAVVANALSESVIDELDLSGIGKFFALTANHEINSLAVLNFSEIFESSEVYQLSGGSGSADETSHVASHLTGNVLFNGDSYVAITNRFNAGANVVVKTITPEKTLGQFTEKHDGAFPMLVVKPNEIVVAAESRQLNANPGDRVVVFVPSVERERQKVDGEAFDKLLTRSHVLDFDDKAEFSAVALQASALLATTLPITAEKLGTGFIEGAKFGAAPIVRGFAIPHFRLSKIENPEMVIIRCKKGIEIEYEDGFETGDGVHSTVGGLFLLVSPQDNPGAHLKVLAQIAGRIESEDFLKQWTQATDAQRLKESLLSPAHYISYTLDDSDPWHLAGSSVADANLPNDAVIALVGRNGDLLDFNDSTILQISDRVTIVGDDETVTEMFDKQTDS